MQESARSLHASAPPLDFELRRTTAHLAFTYLPALLPGVAAAAMPLAPFSLRLALAAASIVLALAAAAWEDPLCGARRRGARLAAGELTLAGLGAARVRRRWVRAGWCLVLTSGSRGGPGALLIPESAVGPETHRQIRRALLSL